MHPILAQKLRLSLYLFIFLQAGLLLAELLVRTAGAPRIQATALAIPLLLIHSFSCLASWYVCRSLPLGATAPGRLLIALAASALLSCGLLTLLGAAWSRAVDRWFEGAIGLYRENVTVVFVFALLLFSLAVAVHYLFIAFEASREAENRAFELKLLAREAELKALKAQIDPHFLFNSLNSISGLATAAPARAREMCVALAAFLRQSLRVGALELHPLAEELALIESYLAVEQLRFGDRLQVEWSQQDDCLACTVPPLILQPLVENSVRHGIAQLIEGGTVRVTARLTRGQLRLAVDNRCDPERPQPRSEGIGLLNVKRRLAASYGRAGSLEIVRGEDRFSAVITLPAEGMAKPAAAPPATVVDEVRDAFRRPKSPPERRRGAAVWMDSTGGAEPL